MKTMNRLIPIYPLIFMLFVNPFSWSRVSPLQTQTTSTEKFGQRPEVAVPSRPVKPLYEGQPVKPGSGIEFTPASRIVTMKLAIEDPNGYFRPNIRRENFAVYEDGVRQKHVTVEVDHSPVSVALLVEFGGRYHRTQPNCFRVADHPSEMSGKRISGRWGVRHVHPNARLLLRFS